MADQGNFVGGYLGQRHWRERQALGLGDGPASRQTGSQTLHDRRGGGAVRREFASVYCQHPRFIRPVGMEDGLAGAAERLAAFGGQHAQAGEHREDVLRYIAVVREITDVGFPQIIDLAVQRPYLGWIALIDGLGGTHQGFTQPWHDEYRAVIARCLDVIDALSQRLRYHDVGALHQIDIDARRNGRDILQHFVDPGSGGVDYGPAFRLPRSLIHLIMDYRALGTAFHALQERGHVQLGAQTLRRVHHGAGEGGVVGLSVGIAVDGIQAVGAQAIQTFPMMAGNAVIARNLVTARKQSIKTQAEANLPRTAAGVAINRQVKGPQPHQFRRQLEQQGALTETFADQGELRAFQIAESAVNEFAGSAGGAGGQRRLFQYQDRMALRRGGLGYARPMNAAAYDYQVVTLSQNIPRGGAAGSSTFHRWPWFRSVSPRGQPIPWRA